jgi:hypothetical protein
VRGPVLVANPAGFLALIAPNLNNLPANAINPFEGEAAAANLMLGYAVFFPAGNQEMRQVYVARKRLTPAAGSGINNNQAAAAIAPGIAVGQAAQGAAAARASLGGIFANLLDADLQSHTERQLIVYLLTSRPSGPVLPAGAGELHIYTQFPPCRNRVPDNGNFACTEYYTNLAAAYPGVHFHIYFSAANTHLNPYFINNPTPLPTVNVNNSDRACYALLNEAYGLAMTQAVLVRDNLRVLYGELQCSVDGRGWNDNTKEWKRIGLRHAPDDWVTPGGDRWNFLTAAESGLTTMLTTAVNSVIQNITAARAELLFNNIHNFSHLINVTYHLI